MRCLFQPSVSQGEYVVGGGGSEGLAGGRVMLEATDVFVDGGEGLSAPVCTEFEFDAEGEDFEAQVRVAGEREEGLEGVEVAGRRFSIISSRAVDRQSGMIRLLDHSGDSVPSQLALHADHHAPAHHSLLALQCAGLSK